MIAPKKLEIEIGIKKIATFCSYTNYNKYSKKTTFTLSNIIKFFYNH